MVQFTSDYQPEKKGQNGGWFKKKIIDGLKRRAMTEDQFVDLLIDKAIKDGGIFLTELLKRYSPHHKPTLEPVVIDNWPKDGTSAQKSEAVIDAMAEGVIPFDLGVAMMEAISKSLGINETTDFMERVIRLEKLLEEKDNG